jgi:hypothetical protein
MRIAAGLVLAGIVATACSSTSSAPPAGATAAAPAPVTQTVGAAGGTVSAPGVTLTIPAGALPAGTSITIAPSADPIPAGYDGYTSLFAFSPDGTVFQTPATIDFTLANAGANPTVYWSNATGGFDALETTPTAGGVSAQVAHFSRGFVGHKRADAPPPPPPPPPPTDAGTDSAADAGTSAGTITATIDGVVTSFATNGVISGGGTMTTMQAEDNASSTHWTMALVINGVPQESCVANGYPYITYTHYTSGAVDLMYSSKISGQCLIVLSKNPTNAGDPATGTFFGNVGALNVPTGTPASHAITNASFSMTL